MEDGAEVAPRFPVYQISTIGLINSVSACADLAWDQKRLILRLEIDER